MFIGHYAVALTAKKSVPDTNLAWLFIAAQFIDLLWPILLLLGIERVEIDPGNTAVTPLNFTNYPYSHSFLFTVIWAIILGVIYYIISKKAQAALVIAVLVLSHWVLDLITHRPDLPIYPGGEKFGLGLWNHFNWAVVIEFILFIIGIVSYLNNAKISRKQYASFCIMAAVLATFYILNVFGPPPPSTIAIAISANALWLFVVWAYYIDRKTKK
jgi:hypothetical protein